MLRRKKIILMLTIITLAITNLNIVNAESNAFVSQKSEELWLQDIQEYEIKMGKIVDEISGTNGIYLALAISDIESDREEFVNYVINNYDKLTDEQKTEINGYLIGYADGVGDEGVRKFVNSKKQISNIATEAYYRPNDARDYASQYYEDYNLDEYQNLNKIGGDCANFVSQCIYYAGKQMDEEWYIRKLNDDNPIPTTTTELNASWDLADPSPWISAKEFGTYWSSEAEKTKIYSVSDYLSLTDRSILGYSTGDVVQITKRAIINYYGYHTMLITDIDGDDFLYSGHYSDRFDENLTDALGSYNSSSYKVKFYAMY